MSFLEGWLYEATNILLTPVVLALVVLGACTLVMFGGFLREWLDRRRTLATATQVGADRVRLATLLARQDLPGMLGRFVCDAHGADPDRQHLANLATRCEIEANRRVSRVNLIGRAGPTLGLMATLIPMGPALTALADDDVSGLARSLVVAFTATVSGLLIGLLCATMGTTRRHWYAADLSLVDEALDDVPNRAEGRAS